MTDALCERCEERPGAQFVQRNRRSFLCGECVQDLATADQIKADRNAAAIPDLAGALIDSIRAAREARGGDPS